MIAVIYIICNLGYIANCIFSWGVTYKWLVIWKNTYLNIPEWLLKQIFSWIIQVLFAGYILRKQPWVPLHSLSLIFIVGSQSFSLCLIRTVSATVPYSYWKNDIIDWYWLSQISVEAASNQSLYFRKNKSKIRCPPQPVQTRIMKSQRQSQRLQFTFYKS